MECRVWDSVWRGFYSLWDKKHEAGITKELEDNMNYAMIYEVLYGLGYHSKQKNHGKRYVKFLCKAFDFKDVLDVGCSNGIAVRAFRKEKKRAYGLDVAEIAIRLAAEDAFVPNCVVGSVLDIPFKDGFFETVFSCDMLEHLMPDDIHKAFREISRVTTKYFFCTIDGQPERNREWINKAKVKAPKWFRNIDNLHMTQMSMLKWQAVIEQHGFKFIRRHGDLFAFERVKQ